MCTNLDVTGLQLGPLVYREAGRGGGMREDKEGYENAESVGGKRMVRMQHKK